ncbi:hypothetical protein SKAU_G00413680 [Synaphobranchus kaupii]|uniref:Uncharacterized protein n=1 Tax=Synaphobranchus kaupii TaxID=118154 RepID=A0A9Q1IBY4_SYNKA|nr:hypothetical protein SKAU_G00413680 [Synaphobranchus kaupii]
MPTPGEPTALVKPPNNEAVSEPGSAPSPAPSPALQENHVNERSALRGETHPGGVACSVWSPAFRGLRRPDAATATPAGKFTRIPQRYVA